MNRFAKLVLVAPMLSSALAFAQLKDTFQKLSTEFGDEFNRGDITTLVNQYTEDARIYPQEEDIVTNRQGQTALWGEYAKALQNFKLTTLDAEELAPDTVLETGTFTMETRKQPAQQLTGKYMTLWRKVGGDWRITRDIFNIKASK